MSDLDLHLFGEGTHYQMHRHFGAHVATRQGATGTHFATWAPNARAVEVIGDWNLWNEATGAACTNNSGVWHVWIVNAAIGHRYKLRIQHGDGSWHAKADPMARASELPPGNASIIVSDSYQWADDLWMRDRAERHGRDQPLSIYEMHLGSWKRDPSNPEQVLSYRELAPLIAAHCAEFHFTHVEFMPVMEHPFTGSWGYQVTGFFAPTARYGTPDDLRWCIDYLHQHNIGVILDWVPAHFPSDAHGLANFDGTALYEHADPREGHHPDWGTLIFNYGRNEVRSFLISNARYWLDEFHADGLRVDAVASMLHRDYSRAEGEWVANVHGGRENLEAISLLQTCSDQIREHTPGALFLAEESTSFPGVTAPTANSGLGFTHKWDLGWMHDTLQYLGREPIHRRWHQNDLTFRALYAHSERFLLPLSHDEVVHGKGSLLNKMPGDDWQRFANLRVLHGLHHTTPGKKLLFMGGEFGQLREWNHDTSLDWHLIANAANRGMARWVAHLNDLHCTFPALYCDDATNTFEWVDCSDAEHSVFAWLRRGATHELRDEHNKHDVVLVLANLTPQPQSKYRVGVPTNDRWELIACSDDAGFSGSGFETRPAFIPEPIPWHDRPHSAELELAPLSIMIYQARR